MSFELQLKDDDSFRGPANLEALEKRARGMVELAGNGDGLDEPLEVCLRLTDDAEIRELNATYRGNSAATDVLAFALREAPGGEAAPHLLGDVVISVETADRQRGDRSLDAEIEFLFAHGLCHLLGYDHQDDREEAAMNARMQVLLSGSAAK